METYLGDEFDHPAKHDSQEAREKWREAVTSVIDSRWRSRHVADLDRPDKKDRKRKELQRNLRISFTSQAAAMRFLDGIRPKKIFCNLNNEGNLTSKHPYLLRNLRHEVFLLVKDT
ncbi:calcium-transporting ATPase 4, plasma membrane-type-like protein isoform X2 [Tanacetum coccineum]